MAKVIFRSYNPNDNLLLPPCLGDYLPQNHPARLVSAIVEKLDIFEIESGLVAVAHNIRKYIALKGAERTKAVCCCL